jgi:dienelactone hydrolase
MIASLLKKLFLVTGYPRLLSFHDAKNGGSAVGVIQVRIPDAIQAQVFYPTTTADTDDDDESSGQRRRRNKNKNSSPTKQYFRPEAVQGLIDYMRGYGDGMLQFLSDTSHPCRYEVDPTVPPSQGYPLVVFSHGLAGTMEMYTQLCSLMSSHGFVVVAVEHEDGSGSYAERIQQIQSSESSNIKGDDRDVVIPYKRPNDEPYSRQKVLNFRTPMLQQRVQEMEDVIKYFVKTHEEGSTELKPTTAVTNDRKDRNYEILHQLASECIDPTQIHLVGHSFGGATAFLAAQKWTNLGSPSSAAFLQPKSVTSLDCWAFALDDRVIETGLNTRPQQQKAINDNTDNSRDVVMPVLSVISESWTTNPETEQIIQFLQSSVRQSGGPSDQSPSEKGVYSFSCRHSVHQSFADSEAWFPSWIARRVYSRGKQEERHASILAVVDAWKRLVTTTRQRQSQIVDVDNKNGVMIPFEIPSDMTKDEQAVLREATTSSLST